MSIYNSTTGESNSAHIHRMERIKELPYRFRCVDCGAKLRRLNGILIPAKQVDMVSIPLTMSPEREADLRKRCMADTQDPMREIDALRQKLREAQR